MKIKSYKKKKNNIYEVLLENGNNLNLYDDTILKYELLLKKEISSKDLEEITLFNEKIDAYNKAIKYITIKLRCEQEIIKKLDNYNKLAIDYTIDRLKKEGYLNKELYIKSYINDILNFKLVGPKKILLDLNKLGFNNTDILNYLDTIDNNLWLNKIDKYINKKINTNHNLSAIILKNKITMDLLNKGFYKEDINIIINKYNFLDDKSIYEKEYNKAKKRLSKKYSGNELNYKIKEYLYRKGFRA